jgi:trimethylamine:corrinoid methyltransferase-like protein
MGKLAGNIFFLNEDELEKLHQNSLKILHEIGFYVPNNKILGLLEKNNCTVDYEKQIVKVDTALVEKVIKEVPKDFSIVPSLEKNKIDFNDGNLKLTMDTTPDIIELSENKKRRGKLEDTLKGIVVGNYLKNVNTVSAYCLPDDVPPKAADIICYRNLFTYSKKPVSTWIYSSESADYIIEMAKIVYGGSDGLQKNKPISYFSESISPLRFAPHTLEIMIKFAEYGLPIFLGPMVTSGGSGPVTLAGAISLQNAEVLMGAVIIYLLNPEQPVVHAGLSHLLDMKTGLCSYGSPEQTLLSVGITQLAKKYGLACCCNVHISDSNCCDFQRGYEAAAGASFAIAAGAEMLSIYGYGPVGAVGSGVGLSLEQMLVDNEGLSYLSRIRKGFEVDENSLAFDIIKNVGIGGTFLPEEHTLKNFKKEHWEWDLFLRQNYPNWKMEGSRDILDRAREKLEKILLKEFPPEPVLDNTKVKELKTLEDEAIRRLSEQ